VRIRKSILLGVGCILFAWVLWRIGWQTILYSFTEIGPNYVWIAFWPLIYYCFYSLGWYFVGPHKERSGEDVSFWTLLKARLVGEAINYLTPLGGVGGEPARTLYMKGRMELHVTAATVIIDRTLYTLSSILFIVAGILLAFLVLDLNKTIQISAMVLLVFFMVAIFFIIFAQLRGGVTGFVKVIRKLGVAKNWVERKLPQLEVMEKTIRDFYRRRPRDFACAFLCHLIGRAGGTLEVWFILIFLGAFSPHSVWQDGGTGLLSLPLLHQLIFSLLIAVFVLILNFAFFMFPSQIGVAEGGTAILFQSMGIDPALGVALQIARRIKSLFYIALGLLLMGLRKGSKSVEAL
jgi:uncharacterized protein (TIRG00374 family)